ncbi:MAG: riboflavin synthase [Clostridiales bacterium]|nr:riboflavin synthase [Clostridiales bacterium]
MFTGLVEEVGTIGGIVKGTDFARLEVRAEKITEGLKEGDSVAVNGLCLTACEVLPDGFRADVMAESLRRSSLGSLRAGSRVNLERAMLCDGRFGGHIVSGHIDGTGKILSLEKEGISTVVKIGASAELLYYIVEKGSIAIDGISLTVMRVDESSFSVGVIPHTGSETALLEKSPGDIVNLETDIIGKYVEKFIKGEKPKPNEEITMEFLIENGF